MAYFKLTRRRAGGQVGRRAGGQAGRRAGGQAGRRAGGQAGRRAGGQAILQILTIAARGNRALKGKEKFARPCNKASNKGRVGLRP